MDRMEKVMQGLMRTRAEGLTVEVLTALIAGVAVLGFGCVIISRRKVCGRGIYILSWWLVVVYYMRSLQWNNDGIPLCNPPSEGMYILN